MAKRRTWATNLQSKPFSSLALILTLPNLNFSDFTSNYQEKNRIKDSPFVLAEIVAAMAYPKVSAGSKSLGSSSDSSTSRGAGWKDAGPWRVRLQGMKARNPPSPPEASFQLKSWQVEANSCRSGRLILRMWKKTFSHINAGYAIPENTCGDEGCCNSWIRFAPKIFQWTKRKWENVWKLHLKIKNIETKYIQVSAL